MVAIQKLIRKVKIKFLAHLADVQGERDLDSTLSLLRTLESTPHTIYGDDICNASDARCLVLFERLQKLCMAERKYVLADKIRKLAAMREDNTGDVGTSSVKHTELGDKLRTAAHNEEAEGLKLLKDVHEQMTRTLEKP